VDNQNRFDKFNESARQALSYAQEEAAQHNHGYIGPEHLLLGLIRDETNVACAVLQNLNIDLVKIRDAVEFIISRGDGVPVEQIGLTPRAKKIVALAVDEARRLNQQSIGTEHLLLGMMREGEGIAAGVLESLGATLEKLRKTTLLALSLTLPKDETGNSLVQTEATEATRPRRLAVIQTQSIKPYEGYPFTAQSHKIIEQAYEEAMNFQHNYIGTEHLLLGLSREREGVAGAVLQNLGVQPSRVRKAVEFIIGRGDRVVFGEIGLTPRSKRILELAAEEAKYAQVSYVGTEHILLGMVTEGEGIAVGILNNMGIQLGNVRAETLRVMRYAEREGEA